MNILLLDAKMYRKNTGQNNQGIYFMSKLNVFRVGQETRYQYLAYFKRIPARLRSR